MIQRFIRNTLLFAAALPLTASVFAQATPAAPKPADDTPTIKVGATIFADYTYNSSPTTIDADGNEVNLSSFNIGRAYINVTGNLNHLISFRITPDIVRESGSGSSLSGSYTYRLKYAYGQLNLDDWTTKGSWVRLGMQQAPYVDYTETIYRYRFQGPIFVDREGFLSSSDTGLSAHWNFPGNYGDVHGGFYNGETYSKPETNDQKAFMLRGSVRPLPSSGLWKGLRVTGFVDEDHYVRDAVRTRAVGQVSFEHPMVNAAFEYLKAKDQTSASKAAVEASGYSVWVTPKFGKSGWEMLLRHDYLEPNKDTKQKRTRNIAGIAYWLPNMNKVTTAVMLDYDSLKQENYSPARKDDTRYGLKLLVNF